MLYCKDLGGEMQGLKVGWGEYKVVQKNAFGLLFILN